MKLKQGNFKLKQDFGVTAMLATILVGGATLASLYMVFKGDAAGLAFLANAALAALGFYVGNRNKTPPTNGGTP